MTSLKNFATQPFIIALKGFLDSLHIPFNVVSDMPTNASGIMGELYKSQNKAHQIVGDVYWVGIVNDAIFENNNPIFKEEWTVDKIKNITQTYEGLLIFGVEIEGIPTRSQLAEITRDFNRTFPHLPVMVIFKYNHLLAVATSERSAYTQNWREGEKIGKVKIVRDVDVNNPHRGHLLILRELAIERSGKNAVQSFADLYAYWQKVLDVSLLNKRFYRELFTWYLWAVQQVKFPKPDDEPLDDHAHQSISVIRLLTRLIFVWFVKEKNLINNDIFDEENLKKYLNDFVPQSATESDYYRAILQNLFFATLNAPMDKDANHEDEKRGFIEDKAKGNRGYSDDHLNHTKYRYAKLFKDKNQAISLFDHIPFLNGGLFECLDSRDEAGNERRYDGFSNTEKKQAHVPNNLFFGDETLDLSKELDDKKQNQVKVKGIMEILKSYKFTIAENTPIEEEVALDPELLGKVFENLLASYNPETQSTARKQTGSFYTPREIVNYMVDESLKAYLTTNMSGLEDDTGLNTLFDTEQNPFDSATTHQLIEALSNCKILDPACGSGAFPMGVLQRMVNLLAKLDPNNKQWKATLLKRAETDLAYAQGLQDEKIREIASQAAHARMTYIRESFEKKNHELDYTRKLFLIENCIYGVDIQQIAVQISKLRFFITLIVEQQIDDTQPNRGILSMPNLETKFVAGNTLIGLDRPQGQLGLFNEMPEVLAKEKELDEIRKRIFFVKRFGEKKKLKKEEAERRKELKTLLVKNHFTEGTARQMAEWNPFDVTHSAPFFDREMMFGEDLKTGFDIVIGNPPYVDIKALPKNDVKKFFQIFETAENRINLYSIFIEKGVSLLNEKGNLIYINPNSMLVNESYKKIRKHLIDGVQMIIKLPDSVFESATVETIILQTTKKSKSNDIKGEYFAKNDSINFNNLKLKNFSRNEWKNDKDVRFNIFSNDKIDSVLNKIERDSILLKDLVRFSLGITPYDKYKGHSEELINSKEFHSETKKTDFHVPLISGKNIHKYYISDDIKEYLKYGEWLGAPREKVFFESTKIIIRQILSGDNLKIVAGYSTKSHFFTQIGFSLISNKRDYEELKYILSLLNSSLMSFYHKSKFLDKEKVVFQKILIANCKLLPIKQLTPEAQVPFITIVDKILLGKKAGEDTRAWEEEIDRMVYGLYELTPAEIAVVEGR